MERYVYYVKKKFEKKFGSLEGLIEEKIERLEILIRKEMEKTHVTLRVLAQTMEAGFSLVVVRISLRKNRIICKQ